MKSTQNLFILFWLFKAKVRKDGQAPIYLRITIDGLEEEISIGRTALPELWDNENKIVKGGGQEARITNQKISQIRTDLDRHFMVLQTQYETITPSMLKNVYNGKEPHFTKSKAGGHLYQKEK